MRPLLLGVVVGTPLYYVALENYMSSNSRQPSLAHVPVPPELDADGIEAAVEGEMQNQVITSISIGIGMK